VGAGGEHDLLGTHLPQALTRPLRRRARRQVIGDLLQYGEIVVVVVAGDRAAREQTHVIHSGELGDGRRHPLVRGPLVDDLPAPEKGAAELALLVGEDYPRARAPRGESGGETRGTAADDQHVAVRVHLVVEVRITLLRRDAEACRLADEVLVPHPEPLRPHEGLVVEAGRKDA